MTISISVLQKQSRRSVALALLIASPIALGAQYHDVVTVTAGTTLGMMIANVPAIFLGHELLKRVDLAKVRLVAATLFLVIGLWVLAQTAGWIG